MVQHVLERFHEGVHLPGLSVLILLQCLDPVDGFFQFFRRLVGVVPSHHAMGFLQYIEKLPFLAGLLFHIRYPPLS